jgi:phosphoribosylformylglycinamidine synthase
LIKSAHDCSRGGLAVALAKCCIAGGTGLDADDVAIEGRLDAALFGEAPSRIVVSTAQRSALEALASRQGVPIMHIGRVAGERLVLSDAIDAPVAELAASYEGGLPMALAGGAREGATAQ